MKQLLSQLIEGKRVAILGFGREGKSTLNHLLEIGGYDSITILDKNLSTEYGVENGLNVDIVSGADYQKDMDKYGVVFKSPGVVLEHVPSEFICNIVSQTELFVQRYKNQIIGITGTKGKSTTTTLIYHILKESGRNVQLAGNVGIPAFEIMDKISEDTIIVYELSSHMLEYMEVSPRIGALLNIYEEHLDHYGTMDKYVAAKMNILKYKESTDICFVNEHIETEGKNGIVKLTTGNSTGLSDCNMNTENSVDISDDVVKFCYDGNIQKYHIPTKDINLLGKHNYFDIGVAYGILKLVGITDEEFDNGLKSYAPLPHRLEYIGEVRGVKYYNDSISTICQTAIQAVETIPNVSTIIIGGMDRGIDYTELEEYLIKSTKLKNIIFMYATGKRIYNELNVNEKSCMACLHLVENLQQAVEKAVEVCCEGEACVMSPASASYGDFVNFEERGSEYTRLVNCYKN